MKKILIGTVLVIGLAVAGNFLLARFGHYGFGMGSGWGMMGGGNGIGSQMMAGFGNNNGSNSCYGNSGGIQERWPSQNNLKF